MIWTKPRMVLNCSDDRIYFFLRDQQDEERPMKSDECHLENAVNSLVVRRLKKDPITPQVRHSSFL